jgi:hypothetical protein
VLRQVEDEGAHQQPDHMRVLAGGVERVLVSGAVEIADGGARLHRIRHQPVVDQLELDHLRGLGEGRLVHRLVADMPVVADIAGDIVMHLRSPRGERRLHGGDGRQDLVLDLDRLGRILRLGPRLGDHRRDGIADEAGLAHGEDGMHRLRHRRAVLVVDLPAAGDTAEVGHVRPGEDRHHPWHCRSRRGVDGDDARMGMRAAQDGRIGLAGPVDVIGVLAAAGQEAQILLALHAGADAFERSHDIHCNASLGAAAPPLRQDLSWGARWMPRARAAMPYSAAGARAWARPCMTSCAAAIALTMLW